MPEGVVRRRVPDELGELGLVAAEDAEERGVGLRRPRDQLPDPGRLLEGEGDVAARRRVLVEIEVGRIAGRGLQALPPPGERADQGAAIPRGLRLVQVPQGLRVLRAGEPDAAGVETRGQVGQRERVGAGGADPLPTHRAVEADQEGVQHGDRLPSLVHPFEPVAEQGLDVSPAPGQREAGDGGHAAHRHPLSVEEHLIVPEVELCRLLPVLEEAQPRKVPHRPLGRAVAQVAALVGLGADPRPRRRVPLVQLAYLGHCCSPWRTGVPQSMAGYSSKLDPLVPARAAVPDHSVLRLNG